MFGKRSVASEQRQVAPVSVQRAEPAPMRTASAPVAIGEGGAGASPGESARELAQLSSLLLVPPAVFLGSCTALGYREKHCRCPPPAGLRDWEDSACQPPSRPLHLTMPIEAPG